MVQGVRYKEARYKVKLKVQGKTAKGQMAEDGWQTAAGGQWPKAKVGLAHNPTSMFGRCHQSSLVRPLPDALRHLSSVFPQIFLFPYTMHPIP